MKTITIFLTALIVSICAVSCYHQGETFEYNVTLKMGSKEYKIKQVFIDENSNYIYVVYPSDSTLKVPIQTTRKNDDVQHTTVILD